MIEIIVHQFICVVYLHGAEEIVSIYDRLSRDHMF